MSAGAGMDQPRNWGRPLPLNIPLTSQLNYSRNVKDYSRNVKKQSPKPRIPQGHPLLLSNVEHQLRIRICGKITRGYPQTMHHLSQPRARTPAVAVPACLPPIVSVGAGACGGGGSGVTCVSWTR